MLILEAKQWAGIDVSEEIQLINENVSLVNPSSYQESDSPV